MGRQFLIVTAVALVGMSTAGAVFGQGQPSPHFRARAFGIGHGRGSNPGRERFYQLSPDERQAFRRNAERWLQMSPQQQKMLREREQVRRQRLKTEAEQAMHQMGLRLDSNAQGQFETRYLQERRRIERELLQEVEAKRQQQLPKLNERLKSEFEPRQGSASGTTTPVVSPSVSAKPQG